MLLQKYARKYGGDPQTLQLINNEIYAFVRTEKLNRDTVKVLEQRIEDKISFK